MKRIVFICHGNLCRSPMAEFVMKKLAKEAGQSRDVADPWYTGDFETTYRDIIAGTTALLKTIG